MAAPTRRHLAADRRDRVFASFGRFYQQVPLNIGTLWYLAYPVVVSFTPRIRDSQAPLLIA